MATIFSPELAEAQTRLVSSTRSSRPTSCELARTEKLVQIGRPAARSSSGIHAEHTAQRTTVDSARSRLELLGISPGDGRGSWSAGGQGGCPEPRSTPTLGCRDRAARQQRTERRVVDATVHHRRSLERVGSREIYESDSASAAGRSCHDHVSGVPWPATHWHGRLLDPQKSPRTRERRSYAWKSPIRDKSWGSVCWPKRPLKGLAARLSQPSQAAVQTIGSQSVRVCAEVGELPRRFVERGVHWGRRRAAASRSLGAR